MTSSTNSPGDGASAAGPLSVSHALDDAPRSGFHRRTVVVSGVGFFTDAYDLFVIGTVATIVATQWHLSTVETSWVTGSAILGAFIGAIVFGRIADVLGRKSVYLGVAVIMMIGAIASAVAPGFAWLVVARFVLGLGIGGDYPVSAVLMSEYSNRNDRGRLVGMVFSMQALGLIVGPLVGLALLESGMSHDLAWRLHAGPRRPAGGLRHLPSLHDAGVAPVQGPGPGEGRSGGRGPGGVLRWRGRVHGRRQPDSRSDGRGRVPPEPSDAGAAPRHRGIVVPLRLRLLREHPVPPGDPEGGVPHATLETKLLWTLGLFVLFAVPGYLLAVVAMDRIGHRRLQFIGFGAMALAFLTLAAFAHLTTMVVPFLLIFGVSYFFVQFGPNMTTFVLPSEVFPVRMRTTGHGIAAGVGKLGAFVGVFLVPQLQKQFGLRGMLAIAGTAAVLGFVMTKVLPEPAGRSLESMHDGHEPPRITPPEVSPVQVAGAFDHGRVEFPLVVRQVPEPRTAAAGQPGVREPLDGPSR